MAYDPEPWHDLLVMAGGAAAALAGLIFVAVSLNHEHILAAPVLPPLAAQTLSLLIGLVLLCAVGLTPGQARAALGGEVLTLGAALTVVVIGSTLRTPSAASNLWWQASRLALGTSSTLPALIAGLSLLLRVGGGLYWLLVDIIAGLVVAAYYAWILLIEIRR